MSAEFLTTTEILHRTRIIPVVVLDDAADALPLARTLLQAGLPVIEITLRTAAALEAIRAIAEELPDATVGAGTVLEPAQFGKVADAGGQFAVSPGATPALFRAARESGLPYLPGCVTPTEIQAAREAGFHALKFFPSEPNGGVSALRYLGDVYPDVEFCPTGGVSNANIGSYLALGNVPCVGGSWVCPRDAIRARDWKGIDAKVREVMAAAAAP